MTYDELPSYTLNQFSQAGGKYTASADDLDAGDGFAAAFSVAGKCTHGFLVRVSGKPRLFLLSRKGKRSWTFRQKEGPGKRIVTIYT